MKVVIIKLDWINQPENTADSEKLDNDGKKGNVR
jgi:hypothetical protein